MKRLLGECCRREGEGLWSCPLEVPEKGLHICLGWWGGGLSPKTQALEGSYRECLVHTEVVFLSQDVAVVPVRLTLACRRAAPASPRIPRALGEFYEYYLLMNKSIKSVFETCKVAFLEMPMIILQTLNISVPIKSKIKYSPEGQEI